MVVSDQGGLLDAVLHLQPELQFKKENCGINAEEARQQAAELQTSPVGGYEEIVKALQAAGIAF